MLDYKRDALWIFIFLAMIFAYFFQDPGANGNSRVGLIFSFVQNGHLNIDAFQDREGTQTVDKSFYNGHFYSDKAIGTALLGSMIYFPIYKLAQFFGFAINIWQYKRILTFTVIGIPAAFAGSLVFVLCKYLTGSKLQSFLITIAGAIGTIYFPFSTLFFSHALAGSLLFCALFMIFKLKVIPDISSINLHLFIIGFLLGFSIITEFPTVLIVVPLIIYFYFVFAPKKTIQHILTGSILPIIGGVIPIIILMIYNSLCFGNPLSIGYMYENNQTYSTAQSQGLMGIHLPNLKVLYYLTVNPYMGLFWQSPVLLLSLSGFYFMFRNRQYRGEAVMIGVSFLFYLLMNSGYFQWWGGGSSGPRHLIPILLFLTLPLAFLPRRLNFLAIIFGCMSIAQMFIITATSALAPNLIVDQLNAMRFFAYSNIYSFCLQQLISGNIAYNLGNGILHLKGWISLVPILLVTLGVIGVFVMMGSKPTKISLPFLDRSKN